MESRTGLVWPRYDLAGVQVSAVWQLSEAPFPVQAAGSAARSAYRAEGSRDLSR